MKHQQTHARDSVVWYDQKTVTAICGKRVPVGSTTYQPLGLPFSCVGCRAIAAERERESSEARP